MNRKTVFEVLVNKFDDDNYLDFRQILRQQTAKGFEKYGKYLVIHDESIDETYALEELVDAVAYLQSLGYEDLVYTLVKIFNEVNRRRKERFNYDD